MNSLISDRPTATVPKRKGGGKQIWVSVSERLPELHDDEFEGMRWGKRSDIVLAYCVKGKDLEFVSFGADEDLRFFIAYYDEGNDADCWYGWHDASDGEEIFPVAWMPLPGAYVEVKESEDGA